MLDPTAVLLGSAATPWAAPGCRCRTCSALDRRPTPSGLRIGDVMIVGTTVRLGETAEPVPVAVGDTHEHDGVRVAGLPADAGRVALVISSRPVGTVLWAPEPRPLPAPTLDALAGAELDVAALGTGRDGEPLSRSLALLRRAGALATGCDVVAIGRDHRLAGPRVASRLALWGARVAPDGACLGRAFAVPAPSPTPRTLVLGPASSGKSAFAETMLAAEPDVDYLPTGATPSSDDADWATRVDVHRRRRPPWWRTLERSALAEALAADGPPLLIDSIGTWVAGVLDRSCAWDDTPGWQRALDAEVDAVVQAWRQTRRPVVAVAEEAGWGVVPATPAGRRFRDVLGTVNRRLADESERVLLVVAGRVTELAEGVPA